MSGNSKRRRAVRREYLRRMRKQIEASLSVEGARGQTDELKDLWRTAPKGCDPSEFHLEACWRCKSCGESSQALTGRAGISCVCGGTWGSSYWGPKERAQFDKEKAGESWWTGEYLDPGLN